VRTIRYYTVRLANLTLALRILCQLADPREDYLSDLDIKHACRVAYRDPDRPSYDHPATCPVGE
jgi:hypothetical protein